MVVRRIRNDLYQLEYRNEEVQLPDSPQTLRDFVFSVGSRWSKNIWIAERPSAGGIVRSQASGIDG